jgi:hypothetical protein
MRHFRRFSMIAALVCAFAFSTYAGGIECEGVVNPPPPPTAPGEMLMPAVQVLAVLLSLS